MITLEKR